MTDKIDPKLSRALNRATGNVQAVVTLRSNHPSVPLQPAETEQFVKSLVERASRMTRSAPKDVTVFQNLQSFAIEANPRLIQNILEQDDVDSASLNQP